MKASDLVVKCLEAEGVRYVFGLPGEEIEDLLFSLEKSLIQFIPTRHEQGASFMADVYGRLTGKAGVCLSTLGPGATNLITGIADAQLDKSPVVAITGQASSQRLHKESHQYLDIVNMFRPMVKWNTSITNPKIIPEVVRKAFKLAEMEKPGATHFELSEDIAKLEVQADPIKPERLRRPAPDYKALQRAVDLLKEARYPLIIAGNGAIRKLASKHLREFVRRTHTPVVSTFMGKGATSDKDSYSLFSMGLKAKDFVICGIQRADLIITIGYDIAEYDPEIWNERKDKKIIHIDFLPAEVYDHYQTEVEIVCDISATLWELNKRVEEERISFDATWYLPLRKAILNDIKSYEIQNDCLTVPGTLNILRRIMGDTDVLISDVGSHKIWIARNFPTYEPNSCIISNGLASMGIALPGGIAAKLAHPGKRIVTAMGDGGFLMNSQEIETAKRLGLGFTMIVFNDNNYGLITWKQEAHSGRVFGTNISNPDFKKYGESFGIKAYTARNKVELEKFLKEAINGEELSLVEVVIDSSENIKLTEKLEKNLCEFFNFERG